MPRQKLQTRPHAQAQDCSGEVVEGSTFTVATTRHKSQLFNMPCRERSLSCSPVQAHTGTEKRREGEEDQPVLSCRKLDPGAAFFPEREIEKCSCNEGLVLRTLIHLLLFPNVFGGRFSHILNASDAALLNSHAVRTSCITQTSVSRPSDPC